MIVLISGNGWNVCLGVLNIFLFQAKLMQQKIVKMERVLYHIKVFKIVVRATFKKILKKFSEKPIFLTFTPISVEKASE